MALALGVLAVLQPGAPVPAQTLRAPDALRLDDPAALLAAAIEARDLGARADAEWILSELSQRHPVVADYADHLRAEILLDQGRTPPAIGVLIGALERYPDSPLRPDFYRLLGDARSAFGDEAAARSAWLSGIEAASDPGMEATLRRSIAESFEREGQVKQAASEWLRLWTDYPTRAAAADAGRRLDGFEGRLGVRLRDGPAWRRHGDRLFFARLNEQALEAYDRALSLGLPPAEQRRARTQRAHTLFRLRRYPEAVESFAALPQEDDVRLWYARSLARADRVPEAIERLEALGAASRSSIGIRSRFLAALLLEGRGFTERAQAQYRRVADATRFPSLASAALWRLGWAAYGEGRWGEVVSHMERLEPREASAIDALRARYWRARALEKQGAPEAKSAYEDMAREFPLTYYGWRARERLGFPILERPIDPPRSGPPVLGFEDLARPRILLRAGLRDDAQIELARLIRRARALSDRLRLAELFTETGDFNQAQRLIVDAYQERLARGPVPGFEEAWWYAWPDAHADLVAAATASPGSVSRELVFSIMREESGYRADVISVSGARGLMQIMEPTGRRLAAAVGRPSFTVGDLFSPEINIQLGAYYLGELSRTFPRRIEAAIASYNAGPNAVSSWEARDGHLDDDEWVEAIPYDQTRAYVKRVMRSLYAYEILY